MNMVVNAPIKIGKWLNHPAVHLRAFGIYSDEEDDEV